MYLHFSGARWRIRPHVYGGRKLWCFWPELESSHRRHHSLSTSYPQAVVAERPRPHYILRSFRDSDTTFAGAIWASKSFTGRKSMLEKQDVRKNRNGRAASAPAPFTAHAPSRRGSKSDVGKSDAGSKATTASSTNARGLKLRRYFTAPGDDGFANVEWELRTAAITGENGKMRLRAARRRGPQELEPDGDQRRGPEILPRHRRDT